MGAYRYCTHPAHIATALLRVGNLGGTVEVALYRYGYKPYLFGQDVEKLNRRMHVTSGAALCAAQWTAARRAGRQLPKYGAFFDRETKVISAAAVPFLTCGHATLLDDYATYPKDAKLLRWLTLPKGFSVAAEFEPAESLFEAR